MILYKYVDSETADLIIDKSTLKFSNVLSLNDPFELMSLHYGEGSPEGEQLVRRFSIAISYGILSLTRTPLNPLMWAHYGRGEPVEYDNAIRLDSGNRSHAGIVFGIDPNEANLNSPDLNVIPAKYGSVIYTSTKPQHSYEHSANGQLYWGLLKDFKPEILEALQRVFLHKSFHWSYEEEVRVVRNINLGHIRSEIQPVKNTSFKEMYVGIRNAFNKTYLEKLKERVSIKLPDCKIFVCNFSDSDWTFNKISIDAALLALRN